MIAFKLNNKKVNIPSTWFDLTFEQYIKIMENKGGVSDILSIFTGIEPDVIRNADIIGLDLVIASLSFLHEVPKFDTYTPQVGKYKLPCNSKGQFNIQYESLAQFEDMRSVMVKVPPNNVIALTKSYADYLSIYLQKVRDGKYDYDKAREMVTAEIYKMPAHEVIIAGSFFLIKLLNSLTGTPNSSPTTSQSQKKSKPVSVASKKRLVRSPRSRK